MPDDIVLLTQPRLLFPCVKVMVTPERIHRAQTMADAIPEDISESIKDGAGRFAGCLGEVCATDYFRLVRGWDISSNEENISYIRDFVVKRNGKSTLIECKCTERVVDVESNYNAHIAASQYGRQKKCDEFLFTSLRSASKTPRDGDGFDFHDPMYVQILGAFPAKDVAHCFYFRRRGEVGPNDTKPACHDEYYAPVNILTPIGQPEIVK